MSISEKEDSMTELQFLYVFTSDPYQNAKGQEGLEAVLIAASFESRVRCLFVHDGVMQINKEQDVTNTGLKQISKTFSALEDFGVEGCYVDQTALLARGMDEKNLMIDARPLQTMDIAQLMREADRVFVF